MSIEKILGGIDKKMESNVYYIKKYNGCEISIGNKSKSFIKNVKTNWNVFKSTYYDNNNLSNKYYNKLISFINDALVLPYQIEKDVDLLYTLIEIINANPSKILNGMGNYLNIYHPLKESLKTLFMSIKNLFENIIKLYIKLRERYDKNAEKNNLPILMKRWSNIDKKNEINSSSLLLLFGFPNEKFEKGIPSLQWDINGIDTKKIVNSKFLYKGFCPNDLKNRYHALLNFPYMDFMKIINKISKYDYKIINSKLKKVQQKINKVNFTKKLNANIKTTSVKKSKLPKHKKNKVSLFISLVDKHINIYDNLIPILHKKEIEICNTAVSITNISNEIDELTNLIKNINN